MILFYFFFSFFLNIKGACTVGCPNTVNPVCGTDGIPYRNDCLLKKKSASVGKGQSLKKLHNGLCAGMNDNYSILYLFLADYSYFVNITQIKSCTGLLNILHLGPGIIYCCFFEKYFYHWLLLRSLLNLDFCETSYSLNKLTSG